MSGIGLNQTAGGGVWRDDNNNTVPWPEDNEFNFTSNWTRVFQPGASSEKSLEGIVLAAIIIGIIATMVLLFSLAIFLDCRNQKLEAFNGKAKKSWRPSKKKSRIPIFIANSAANKDAIAFANEMCAENSVTNAPAPTSTSAPYRGEHLNC